MQYYILCILCLHHIQSRRCIMIIALQPQPVGRQRPARRHMFTMHPPKALFWACDREFILAFKVCCARQPSSPISLGP